MARKSSILPGLIFIVLGALAVAFIVVSYILWSAPKPLFLFS